MVIHSKNAESKKGGNRNLPKCSNIILLSFPIKS